VKRGTKGQKRLQWARRHGGQSDVQVMNSFDLFPDFRRIPAAAGFPLPLGPPSYFAIISCGDESTNISLVPPPWFFGVLKANAGKFTLIEII
jgi:hypothetical protein